MASAAARRYARAVFELAEQDGRIDHWGESLSRLRELLGDPEVAAVMVSPAVCSRILTTTVLTKYT